MSITYFTKTINIIHITIGNPSDAINWAIKFISIEFNLYIYNKVGFIFCQVVF
uniref:Uncharacterized protein n=1 Tax=Podoviridae sp. ctC8s18 TaxID=2827617 RepID=A0A8S5LQM9_9CAUD|nr:MAG TPA: hypothetical protein [Podoviridae sp. ctC8s18]